MPEDRPIPSPAANGNPAEEGTVPFEPAQGGSGKETVANKGSGSETANERRQDANRASAPTPESTLEQDSKDVQSAVESSATADAKPQVPGYVLEEKLGQGTYGVVWRAVEISTNKRVAVKFFHRRAGEMWQIVWAEIKQLALLDAVRGIIQLKNAEPDAIPPYFVMNYAEGGSLFSELRNGPMPAPQAREIFKRMVESMAYVHAKGIRHCDLKPANVLLDARGMPLIADFGQAHLSMESQASSVNLGTFYYMAPEQADLSRQIPDTRWDVYGLGAIFYCMLTGEPPRASTELSGELHQTLHLSSRLTRYQEGVAKASPPVKHRKLPGMDRYLSDILEKCLHLDPARRYQNASEVQQALEDRERYLRKRPMLILGLAASVLLVVCLGALAYWLVHVSAYETQQALEKQILQNDKTTVKLIANVVPLELRNRKEVMERLAANGKLLEHIQAFRKEATPAQIDDGSYINNESALQLEDLLFRTYRPGINLLIFYHADGRLLVGGYPERVLDASPEGIRRRETQKRELRKIYGRSYAYRDYYHGKGGQAHKPGDNPPYLEETYVSEPYESTLEEKGEKPWLVAISTPVYERGESANGGEVPTERGKLLGILIGYIYLHDLHEWLKGVEVADGSAVLVNKHGQCVFHSEEGPKHLLAPMPRTHKEILDNHLGQETHFEDEITGKKSLASFAYMKEDSWGAVVLHYRNQVFQPIRELRWTLFEVIVIVSGICAGLLAGVWIWLLRTMRGKQGMKPA